MSRYPGSQFKVVDNTNVAASVAVATRNPSAPVYLSSFRSVKGPESINTVSGSGFYSMYGNQANVLFNKYGQPLLQASMNINGGATLISKRAVLDDAHLANATVCMVLSKVKNSKITVQKVKAGENAGKYYVKKAELTGGSKYILTPLVISVPTATIDTSDLYEYKDLYSKYFDEVVETVNSNKVINETKLKYMNTGLSVFCQSDKNPDGTIDTFSHELYSHRHKEKYSILPEAYSSVSVSESVVGGISVDTYLWGKTLQKVDDSIIYKVSDIYVTYSAKTECTYDGNTYKVGDLITPTEYLTLVSKHDKASDNFERKEETKKPSTNAEKYEVQKSVKAASDTIRASASKDSSSADKLLKRFHIAIVSNATISEINIKMGDLITFEQYNEYLTEDQRSKCSYCYITCDQFNTAFVGSGKENATLEATYTTSTNTTKTVTTKKEHWNDVFTKSVGNKTYVTNDSAVEYLSAFKNGASEELIEFSENDNEIYTFIDNTKKSDYNTKWEDLYFNNGTFIAPMEHGENQNKFNYETGKYEGGTYALWDDHGENIPSSLFDIIVETQFETIYNTIAGNVEYIFPLFTVADNGRGESTKTMAINYDGNSSKTLKKSIYNLKISDYKSDNTLENFTFSLNPYTRNNNTGYTMDIESAVNTVSTQIRVKMHYDSYEKLLNILQSYLDTTDDDMFSNNDLLFGHNINGSSPYIDDESISNYKNKILKIRNFKYNYSDLPVAGVSGLSVNVFNGSSNMTEKDSETTDVRYYFYNYPERNKYGISERLMYGTDGYDLSMYPKENITLTGTDGVKTIEADYGTFTIPNNSDGIQIASITGLPVGTVITDCTLDPINESNFFKYYIDKDIVNSGFVHGGEGMYKNGKNLEYNNVKDGEKYDATQNYEGHYTIYIPYTKNSLYDIQYTRFFDGSFDRDIFNLDILFPTACFDANYCNTTKVAIQRLAAYRGDFIAFMDMGIGKVKSYEQCSELIPSTDSGTNFTGEDTITQPYIRDMHEYVTCLYYNIRDPYTNKQITVTGTYGLSNVFINHFISGPGKVFAGKGNGIIIGDVINGTVNYIPKIYPTSNMTSLNNIGMVYPSDDSTIRNEKQLMCDLGVNYGCYYDGAFVVDTEYTLNPTNSEFSYVNNVILVNLLMQDIRRECPAARFSFVDTDDLDTYQKAVNVVINAHKSNFASVRFRYIENDEAIANKIFYAAIEVVFRPFAQAEVFTITALNYSTLNESVTTV